MSISFQLAPFTGGYTLEVLFPFGSSVSIPFTQEVAPIEGVTIDIYSQNGKVDPIYPLSYFSHRDVREVKKGVACPLDYQGVDVQVGFVLDLKDENGRYEDMEAIRQS